ncbi:glycoside hydrolase family 32 protein [Salegentibacter sp. F188]|uniref:Glycoside hydrolase family 32 protein n=1 Tax=Autumnicola patrickiae TaxID=3075591 RepID=A0ABU3E345_9FLAO|nr:glycoside hydrolase family 32 protein [Salegentibacter sp. F188]MDT0690425.1 glycoside hydrolase family 32 protein [Salegentibacter sp. F188]
MKKLILVSAFSLFLAASTISCQDRREKSEENVTVQSDSDFRPNFHFTPDSGWMNDPNGMFYLDGTYHLFFQHNPDDNVWGPMHWGHATSTDLIIWEEQPIAIEPDEYGTIFSGSAVVDHKNTSGLGDGTTPPVIAIFTYHDAEAADAGDDDYQTQGIAYSLDKGKTWIKYKQNPVLQNPGIRDFRDPKVGWHEEEQKWIMALAVQDRISFYSSPNLLEWEHQSDFGENMGGHGGVWECPDLFKMTVEETGEEKWVLLVSINPGGPNGGSATQYFVGDFDGGTFTPDKSIAGMKEEHDYWIDFGKDNYAGVTWSNIPESDGRDIFIGWMSNWQYANEVPTEQWRSSMTVPRNLRLKKDGDTYRILSSPVKELEKYFSGSKEVETIKVGGEPEVLASSGDFTSTVINFKIPNLQDQIYLFTFSNEVGDNLKFGYSHIDKEFFLDRGDSGLTDFNDVFGRETSTAPRLADSHTLDVEIVMDKTSIEIFYDNGKTVMTEIFFPREPYEILTADSKEDFELRDLQINQLNFN